MHNRSAENLLAHFELDNGHLFSSKETIELLSKLVTLTTSTLLTIVSSENDLYREHQPCMFSDKGVYRYTVSCSRKHKVPKVRAFSLDQIRRGDHLCFDRVFYWHHAIVETADKSNGEVNVIEYSNFANQFSQGNSSPPGLAVVVRRKFKLENESVYVIKHDRCYDPETVVSRAKSKLGERKYRPVTNNCEHFALWCKTGISSSEQVNNVKDAFETGVNDVKDAFNTGAWLAAFANTGVIIII